MTSRALLLGAVVLATSGGGAAYAQSQAQIANQLDEAGKQLMLAHKYSEASAKFREAVARVPEARYFFDLCSSLFEEGKFAEAVTACRAVDSNTPSADLHDRTGKLLARIEDEAKAQQITLDPPRDGSGGAPDAPADRNPTAPTMTVGSPPALVEAVRPDQDQVVPANGYTWSLGAETLLGGGRIGEPHGTYPYGTVTGGLRMAADYLFAPEHGVGGELYFQLTHVGMEGQAVLTSFPPQFAHVALDIVDVGVAVYKHVCVGAAQHVCITPLAGAQLSMMNPEINDPARDVRTHSFNYAAVGGRAEVRVSFLLGPRGSHVLSLALGVNVYSGVVASSGNDTTTTEMVGLDDGGAFGYLGFGYTYRFGTSGPRPFITLE